MVAMPAPLDEKAHQAGDPLDVPFIPYETMSKADLVKVAYKQLHILQRNKRIISLDNEVMALGEKAAWIEAQGYIHPVKPPEDGMVRLPIDKIAENIGMSDSTVSRYARALIARFGATVKEVPHTSKKGQKSTLLFIDHTEPVWNEPWDVPLSDEQKRVINGNKCPQCGEKTYHTKDTILSHQKQGWCESCGLRQVGPVKYGPTPLKPGTYFQGEYTPLGKGEYEEEDEEKGLQAEEPFGAENEKAQKSECLTYPSTPPPVASFDPSLSPEQVEQEVAQLLLDIAGPSTSHILMTNRTPDEDGTYPTSGKYITVKAPLMEDDTLAHIRGEKTVGDFLRHADGQTRAACYDGDGSADWQRLTDAARMLAIVGFKPLLEACPMDCASGSLHAGGGRLWVIIDALVDAYSLHQTLYQYAPILKDIKESWPAPGGNHVRLPGGKYRQGDRAEWCKLYDANAQELSADGPGAARVLLENQASANLVNEYVKPEPVILPERTEHAKGLGGYLDSDLVKRVIAEFSATHSWAEIAGLCGGSDRHGKFPAVWRGDRTPNVAVDKKTDLAKDFSSSAWLDKAMDRYQVWCLIHGGQNWEAWKRTDLAERCKAMRDERPATPLSTPIQEVKRDAPLFAGALPDPSYRAYYEQMGKWA